MHPLWLATRGWNVMASQGLLDESDALDLDGDRPVFAGTNQSVVNDLLVGQQPLILARRGELEQDIYQGLVQLFISTSPFFIVGLVQI